MNDPSDESPKTTPLSPRDKRLLQIVAEAVNGATLVRVAGMVESGNAEQLDNNLSEIVNHDSRLVIDLADVDMMSSSGLGLLIKHTETLSDPENMVLVGLQPRVLEVFRALGLDQFFVIHQSLDDALDHLKDRE